MGQGGGAIADAISQSSALQMLDLSFNFVCGGVSNIESPSSSKKLQSSFQRDLQSSFSIPLYEDHAEKWRKLFLTNTSLVHVDLSHNNIKMQDCKLIAEGLKSNHKILGLHFQGNQAQIDH